jgi:hypothetical protein
MRLRHTLMMLVVLAVPAFAHGTCSPYPYNFSEVDQVAVDLRDQAPPTTIYYTVTVSGTTSMDPNCVPAARHYAKVYNQFNGVGGWTTGQQVCTNCFTTASSTTTANYLADFYGNTADGGGAFCTVGGNFISFPSLTFDFEEATTKSQNTWTHTPSGNWLINDWCNSTSEPPDWNPNAVNGDPSGHSYYESLNECKRVRGAAAGTPWTCFFTQAPLITDTSTLRVNCTNHDKNVQGFSFNWPLFHIQQVWRALKEVF